MLELTDLDRQHLKTIEDRFEAARPGLTDMPGYQWQDIGDLLDYVERLDTALATWRAVSTEALIGPAVLIAYATEHGWTVVKSDRTGTQLHGPLADDGEPLDAWLPVAKPDGTYGRAGLAYLDSFLRVLSALEDIPLGEFCARLGYRRGLQDAARRPERNRNAV